MTGLIADPVVGTMDDLGINDELFAVVKDVAEEIGIENELGSGAVGVGTVEVDGFSAGTSI